ncbi:hypothetical protein [Bifidobacterium scardovii]|uniref:Helix-turn-helix domain-containing protein n=1 Tax=Bifidobacterium scardovii TaxID=158787 RepID=A0A087DGR0_9BIFI|nr:hypothetical protein [Bifidobacterium scardovii]DAE55519.1 MAG TPA: excisionase [Caudoviricetes sp.]KFI94710.1 hypothetical protein BSCA_0762 [Bifidobacterium scardovii]MDK6349846.1 DNA-binding protein [Bifidobacterium scardovii]MDU8982550.1 DNA-binding protein [Bifidobacterium scardovii]BAQ32066.1 hypothetical protein BBSC_1986 [Bifidobacterium scardovii JCM 12489 = DSM 13734]
MPVSVDGVRTDGNPVPLWEREALTLPQAAQVFNLDYEGLLHAVRRGDIDVFRPPNKQGRPGRRRVRREEMIRWIKSIEQ